MSCRNKTNNCSCTPSSPCDEKQQYCCTCYTHQWYNAPRYSECSRRIKVNDISACGCGCSSTVTAQDNFSYNSCGQGCSDNHDNLFSELDEIYWQ